jgi:Tfp pilus assembly protein PilN
MAKSAQINLLSKGDFSSTPLGQALRWVLGAGRWIITITQLIVISAFLSRFYLDRQISDLNDIITQKQAIARSFTVFEQQFLQTQSRLQLAGQILSAQLPYDRILEQINTNLPSDTQIRNVKIDSNHLTLTLASLLDSSIDTTTANLSAVDLFSDVKLSKISLETRDVYIEYEIQATVNPT